MKLKATCLVVFFSLLQFACERKQMKQISFDTHAPKVVEARGYTVLLDSMAPPKVVPVPRVKSIVASKPKVVNPKSNVFPVGSPRIIQAGIPKICTPGQDTFKLPKVIPAIADSAISAQFPEVILAKDPEGKENNPESFMSFRKSQGLKSSAVLCNIIQDKKGNLWFSTWGGGVTKYDGRSFTHYSTPQGLSDDIVYRILEDKNGNLWFGTRNGDLNKYDGKSFTHYSIGYLGGIIIEDKTGNLWFGALSGLIKYDGKSFTIYTTAQGLSTNGVWVILEDKRGNLWFDTDGRGLTRYDGRSFTHYTRAQGLSSDFVTSLFEDKNGILWIGTLDSGLNKFDGKSFTHYTTAQGLSSDYAVMILDDKNGNLWICTDDKGVNKYDGKSFTHFGIDQGLSNNIKSILEDKSGNLWIGTAGDGLTKYEGRSFTHYSTAQGLNPGIGTFGGIGSILEDKRANLWFGIPGGVSKYDGRSFTYFGIDQGLRRSVTSLLEDKSDNLWFSTWGAGVYKYDGKSFTNYTTAQGLSSDFLGYIFEDKSGNLWIATWIVGGVVKYDGKSFSNYSAAQGFTDKVITCISEDKNSNLWFGTIGEGVIKYDGRSFTRYSIANGLNDSTVYSILEDKSNNLWFGTNSAGVNKFDGKSFTQYTTAQGLSNNTVTGILEDKIGDIWFGTRNGISRMQLSKQTLDEKGNITNNSGSSLFKNYLFSDGFLGVETNQLISNTLCQDSTGNIWVGTNDRLTCFHPEGDLPDTIPPGIQLTGISLFNENINWLNLEKRKDTSQLLSNGVRLHDFKFSGLSNWYYIPEQLELVYNNNYLTFQFIGITTQRPRNVKYQYLLEGLDKNWSSLTDKPEASYSNLPHGHYTFKVKAVNSEGYWSNEFTYDFTILPPWWKTTWFGILKGIALVFAGGMIFLAIYYNRRQKFRNISRIRNKIASDLHDDLGATLSSISIMSELVNQQVKDQSPQASSLLEKIGNSSRNMIESVNDMVWAINPQNDSFENIIKRMRGFAAEILAAKDIAFHFDFDKNLVQSKLKMEMRRNFYLIFKEAVNNAAKYSGAANTYVMIWNRENNLKMTIRDDGSGFEMNTVKAGNGLINMRQRAELMKGRFNLETIPGKGTIIELEFKNE